MLVVVLIVNVVCCGALHEVSSHLRSLFRIAARECRLEEAHAQYTEDYYQFDNVDCPKGFANGHLAKTVIIELPYFFEHCLCEAVLL